MSTLSRIVNHLLTNKPDEDFAAREQRILQHYEEQIEKGRMRLYEAAAKAHSDIKGKNSYT